MTNPSPDLCYGATRQGESCPCAKCSAWRAQVAETNRRNSAPSPDLPQPQVEAESIANDQEFHKALAEFWRANDDPASSWSDDEKQFITHIDSIITARVAAARQDVETHLMLSYAPLMDAVSAKHRIEKAEAALAASQSAPAKHKLSDTERAALAEAAKTGATVAEMDGDGIMFINYGHDLGENAHLECPACSGSGHIEDFNAWQERQAAPDQTIAQAIHYPNCWDTAAYPALADALSAVYDHFKCSECQAAPPKAEGWISVDDERPAFGQSVWIAILFNFRNAPPNYSITDATYRNGNWISGDGNHYRAPTHWQPQIVPAAPSTPAKEPT